MIEERGWMKDRFQVYHLEFIILCEPKVLGESHFSLYLLWICGANLIKTCSILIYSRRIIDKRCWHSDRLPDNNENTLTLTHCEGKAVCSKTSLSWTPVNFSARAHNLNSEHMLPSQLLLCSLYYFFMSLCEFPRLYPRYWMCNSCPEISKHIGWYDGSHEVMRIAVCLHLSWCCVF